MNKSSVSGCASLVLALACSSTQAGAILTAMPPLVIDIGMVEEPTSADLRQLVLIDRQTDLVSKDSPTYKSGPFEAFAPPIRPQPVIIEAPLADQWVPPDLGLQRLQALGNQHYMSPGLSGSVHDFSRFIRPSELQRADWAPWKGPFPSGNAWSDADYNAFYYSSMRNPYTDMSTGTGFEVGRRATSRVGSYSYPY